MREQFTFLHSINNNKTVLLHTCSKYANKNVSYMFSFNFQYIIQTHPDVHTRNIASKRCSIIFNKLDFNRHPRTDRQQMLVLLPLLQSKHYTHFHRHFHTLILFVLTINWITRWHTSNQFISHSHFSFPMVTFLFAVLKLCVRARPRARTSYFHIFRWHFHSHCYYLVAGIHTFGIEIKMNVC